MKIDLNCDLGEGVLFDGKTVDHLIMPHISSANIACGLHAGDRQTMADTITLALACKVGIGAHPGYNDRLHFGRRFIPLTPKSLKALIKQQLNELKSLADAQRAHLRHFKAHGALYNAAASDSLLANIIAETVQQCDPEMIVVGLPHSEMERASCKSGLKFVAEAFADRAYNDDGSLVARSLPGAVISESMRVIERCLIIVKERKVQTITGNWIPIKADTICVHGDNPHAPALVKNLKIALEKEGVNIQAFENK
jgi:5-oxoprolinase (ATP-hydrolysing) subunit A